MFLHDWFNLMSFKSLRYKTHFFLQFLQLFIIHIIGVWLRLHPYLIKPYKNIKSRWLNYYSSYFWRSKANWIERISSSISISTSCTISYLWANLIGLSCWLKISFLVFFWWFLPSKSITFFLSWASLSLSSLFSLRSWDMILYYYASYSTNTLDTI